MTNGTAPAIGEPIAPRAAQAELFGQPIGLWTLFMTEMWERFSYYGMRALLVLFLVDSVAHGGFGVSDKTATAVYALYTASAYLFNLPGGWIADRLIGAQQAVLIGGIIIALGHITLGVAPDARAFYLGLMVIVLGTALLKPNISAIVAGLYPEGGTRSDAGFTIFYMGINVGATLGPLVTAWLAQTYGWHWGFGAAAVGMIFGVFQFLLTRHRLGGAGLKPHTADGGAVPARTLRRWLIVGGVLLAVLFSLTWTGQLNVNPIGAQVVATWVIVAMSIGYFFYLFVFAGLKPLELKKVCLLLVLFLGCALFWSGFEQAGSSFNLFADRYTNRMIGSFQIPAGWFQFVNPGFILIFAPVFSALWVRLGRRNLDPSSPVKFALGLVGMALGFVIMAMAARYVAAGQKVGISWLTLTYLFHTFGELCLSPVGLSAVSQLVPTRFVGQSLGVWFLGTALGNLIAGRIAGDFDANNVAAMPGQYLNIFWFGIVCAVLLLFAGLAIHRWIQRSSP
ncbi:MAG TPA: peptide MFS transporter [Steroidobacteraceae bacterium]|nr:peptide MFS transporter [Steroidobacteraceae bacterium]